MITYTDMPATMRDLPRDSVGHPVPWFVAVIDGTPDFRIVGPGKVEEAMRCGLCWVCGHGLKPGGFRAFTIGPMCTVNRVSAEPPAHLNCATWSARNCPFLANPKMVRRERHLPAGVTDPPGVMIPRNPGATCVWVTGYRGFIMEPDPNGPGVLFRLGDPKQALWFREGREATRDEVMESINTGLPSLAEIADGDPGMLAELDLQVSRAIPYIPRKVPS